MTIHYQGHGVTLHHGDCLDVLRTLPDASVDSVVTDPPYGLGFMGREWDALPPGREWAEECLRVLKPGGHLLAFGGTRTWHRLACAVEDAGFEVRDSIAWMYGSGFPKSLDVSKAIDKRREEDRAPVDAVRSWLNARRLDAGLTHDAVNKHFGHASNGGGSSSAWMTNPTSRSLPTWDQWQELKSLFGFGDDMDAEVWRLNGRKGAPGEAWDARVITGMHHQGNAIGNYELKHGVGKGRTANERRDAPATPDAERWQGWGTALKPAFEPVVVARKPLSGTVAANVLAHGTGALNIDGCRIGDGDDRTSGGPTGARIDAGEGYGGGWSDANAGRARPSGGRWPANVVLDESQAEALDEQSGTLTSGANPTRRGSDKFREAYGDFKGQAECDPARGADAGGASRFFYVAKAPKGERPSYAKEGAGEGRVIEGASGKVRECRQCGNRTIRSGETQPACGHNDFAFVPTAQREERVSHPTVKPLALMRWLVRLVTPPGGTVLEPFAGSGTTVEACIVEGFDCIAIEKGDEYLPLIMQRIHRRRDPVAAIRQTGDELGLFELDGEGA
jgi:DNA modification methylase